MLENLDKIAWQDLNHAYGEASDVPDLIRTLASRSKETREAAIYELYGNIWHQGTVYEATSYAAPFLIELLGSDKVQGKDAILVLLFHLASGHSYKEVHRSIQARFMGEDAVNSPEYQAEMQVELYWVKQAHEAVAEGMRVYFTLLDHPEPEVRLAVPYTLACLHEHAVEILPVVAAHLETEDDPQVRASLLLCMGTLATDHTQAYAQLFRDTAQMEKEHPLVKLTAAMGLVASAKEHTPPEVLQGLVEAISYPEEVEEAYNALPWNDSGVVADTSRILCHLEPAAASIALSPCLEALKKANSFSALSLTQVLLYFVFGRSPLPKGATVEDLTDTQKTVLTTLVECDRAWGINANMSSILGAFGLPRWHEDMRAFLRE